MYTSQDLATTAVGAPTSKYGPLECVTRPLLTTQEAAYYLNRAPQTLRCWACHQDGPLQPVRSNGGPLGWRTSDVRRLVEEGW
jgi:hypothetical protein